MRKLILPVLFIFLMTGLFTVSTAAEKITERPDIRIVIDGKAGAYTNVPIIVNGNTLLPLRELLTNLGVTNDDRHIIWDGKESAVTVIKDNIEIFLKVGSPKAAVNGKQTMMTAAPVNYHGKVYLPARFIAQALGKAVAWDSITSCVYIQDQAQYDEVKRLLDQSLSSMDKVKRYQVDIEGKTALYEEGEEPWEKTEAHHQQFDREKDIIYSRLIFNYGGSSMEYLSYYSNLIHYAKFVDEDLTASEWSTETMTKADYINTTTYCDPRNVINPREVIYSSLQIEEDKQNNTTYLRGNVYPLNKFDEKAGLLKSGDGDLSAVFLEIRIDNKTGYITQIHIKDKVKNNSGEPGGSFITTTDGTYSYHQINGDFSITLPQDVTKKPQPYTIQSEDKKFSAVIPASWSIQDDLNDEADLQASRAKEYRYMVALMEAKEDLTFDFETWLDIVLETFREDFPMDETKLSEPSHIKINGNPATQYVFNASREGINFTFLLTYIDGKKYYGQILCWTLKSEYKDSENEFKQIVNSIKGL